MPVIFKKAKTESELKSVFPLIHQLRPHLTLNLFLEIVEKAAQNDSYEILAAYDSAGKCLAAMGYRILFDLVHGKHLYIDDLCVSESMRSQGIGARLLKEADAIALENDCKLMRLCTGTNNNGAMKFYERESWSLRSVVYKKQPEAR